MNPVLKNRRTLFIYSILMLLFAMLYSSLLGVLAGISIGCVVADTIVYWLFFGLSGIMVWNILSYAIPADGGRFQRNFMIITTGIIVVCAPVGMEAAVARICLGKDGFTLFTPTIPLRALITAMGYIIFLLYYVEHLRKNSEEEAEEETTATPKQQAEEVIERITIKKGQKIKVIETNEIDYLQAEGDYVAIVTPDGRWLKEQTMKYFEEHLPVDFFARIHRSYIVNMSRIARLERYGSQYQVVLKGGESIKVSANGYKILKERLDL